MIFIVRSSLIHLLLNCRVVDHLQKIAFVTIMLIPLGPKRIHDTVVSLIFSVCFTMHIQNRFLTIITTSKSCIKTLDIMKYFSMILNCRTVQKMYFAQPTIFKCQRKESNLDAEIRKGIIGHEVPRQYPAEYYRQKPLPLSSALKQTLNMELGHSLPFKIMRSCISYVYLTSIF